MHINDILEKDIGFSLDFKLQPHELEEIRKEVRKHWLYNLEQNYPALMHNFENLCMTDYHLFSYMLQHQELWSKKNRIFPSNVVTYIRKTQLMQFLQTSFGDVLISNEEGLYAEEIYWRLVRPNQPDDIGPLHADAWFWDLGHGKMPVGYKRVKIWIALYCEPGVNGLRVVPHSQKKNWPYEGEYRDGFVKPKIQNETAICSELIYTNPGDAIVFHDKLLHGGALNQSKKTRVSMEWTILIRE